MLVRNRRKPGLGDCGVRAALSWRSRRQAGGAPAFRRCALAVTSCAGANGFSMRMLFGTPLDFGSTARHVDDVKVRSDFPHLPRDSSPAPKLMSVSSAR